MIGNLWARHFAAGECFQMNQPLCERIACKRVGGRRIPNCKPPSAAFRRSFEAAEVDQVSFKGNAAAAWFSNGEVIELYGDAGTWSIRKVGGDAGRGFFG